MLKFALPAVAALAAGLAFAVPANAQNTLVIYGSDRCPENQICVRAPESERYRIPKGLRAAPLAAKDQPWAKRASSVANAGAATGTGSCTATGAGGWTGCWNKIMNDAKAENTQTRDNQNQSPLPR